MKAVLHGCANIFFYILLNAALQGLVPVQTASAEPWLSTRFAQNCAACHAPGRINLQAKDRRCSLSCQGCHVNPNGGGLRSHYGKWNEDRVLRTWITKGEMHRSFFAPNKDQIYSKKPWKKLSKKQKRSKKFRRAIRDRGLRLVTTDNPDVIDKEHDRYANPYDRVAKNRIEFLYQVPQEDPYREMFASKFDGGADFRWQWVNGELENKSSTGTVGDPVPIELDPWLMEGSFQLRYRPVYKKYHLVYESRMLGYPTSDWKTTLSTSQTRSLYFMVDDLPYNVFAMYGFYKPLFGNYSPDHTLLSQKMTANTLNVSSAYSIGPYEAISVGTAPNVPYGNLHLITGPMGGESDIAGYALNTGLRFVSYGASVNYSYWNTEDGDLNSVMHSLHLGAKFGIAIINYEALSFAKDTKDDFRQGGAHFLDLRLQAYKEIYGVFQYSLSNVKIDLSPGEANQLKVGVQGFLFPGVDVQLLYETLENLGEDGSGTSTNQITSQLHLYI